jgi:hypothetical protein
VTPHPDDQVLLLVLVSEREATAMLKAAGGSPHSFFARTYLAAGWTRRGGKAQLEHVSRKLAGKLWQLATEDD